MLDIPLDADHLAQLFGTSVVEVRTAVGPQGCGALSYRRPSAAERDVILLEVLKHLEDAGIRVSGENDPAVWERGWGQIRDVVARDGFNLKSLKPQYFRNQMVLRLAGDYACAPNEAFVTDVDILLRRIAYSRYLAGSTSVLELGCGTGLNLLLLRDILPQAKLAGADWARASVEILDLASREPGSKISGSQFNMLTLEGRERLPLGPDTTVLTVHSMEQLGSGFQPLLDMLMLARPKLCVHFEPIVELYNPAQLFDALAIRYHKKRNYLQNYLPALQGYAERGLIEILDVRRLGFGSQFHEAYSLVVWRPR